MRDRKLICVIGIGLLAAVCIQLWDRDRPEPPKKKTPKVPQLSFLFQGYSNSPSGEKWGILMITNRDVCSLYLDVPVRVRFSDHPDLQTREVIWGKNPIPRQSSCQLAIYIPPESGRWSFECQVIRYEWKEGLRDLLPNWADRWVPQYSSGSGMAGTGWIQQ